ncbi:hypothetical protein EXIGLDRAFT_707951 [Exidia glandulosa HHB12029]|uniref:Uncharacterized protein n=1 Tax=Exidia glandulosa HHB12029 TaxID=1314781 RepID=A0A166NBW3_EXIGL|nr:hypothetical protein EXIGLDRAFT_707951 [Exidia glandulosa HHB12029]
MVNTLSWSSAIFLQCIIVSVLYGPEAYLTLITTSDKTLGQAGQISGVALADYMTVYRCWAIWGRNWLIVVVPILTLIATFGEHHVDVTTSIFSATVTRWTEAWLACSLCTTGICTVYKLTSVNRNLRQSGVQMSLVLGKGSLASRVVFIMIESAAIYSVTNLLYCVLYAVEQVPETWFSGMESTVASITFSLIIIRVDQAVASGIELVSSRSTRPSSDPRTRRTVAYAQDAYASDTVLDMKPPTLRLDSPRGVSGREMTNFSDGHV